MPKVSQSTKRHLIIQIEEIIIGQETIKGTIAKGCATKELIKIGEIVDLDQDLKRAEIEQKIEIVESIATAKSQEIRGQRGAKRIVIESHIKVIREKKGTH